MTGGERANLLAGTCAHECKTTWAVEHGGALPGGPFPGEYAREGDVRRCEHGKVWEYDPVDSSYRINHWRQLHWFWDGAKYRRAVRLLAAARVRQVGA